MPPNDDALLERLPAAHAAVLRLQARGFDATAIAKRLGVEPEGVPPLLLVADAKLAALRREDARRDARQ